MKITQFKVTNYRNVWDSDWIEINNITAFVGQNEAGKSISTTKDSSVRCTGLRSATRVTGSISR